MARRIVITSGKGGVGKTAITGALGLKLAEMGKRVVLLDLDFGLNNLDVVCGVESSIVYDIIDVLEGRCRVKQSLIQTAHKNLYVIPSSHCYNKDVSGQKIKLLIEGLSGEFDYVLIDCPAGIDFGFERAISSSNEALVVVNPNVQSIRDADKVLTILKSYQLEGVFLIVNKVRPKLVKKGKMLSENQIENILQTKIISVIHDSDEILLCKDIFLPQMSKANKQLKQLAKNVEKNFAGARNFQQVYGGLFKGGN